MPKKNRIYLSYTRREWILIERAIEKRGKKNGVISYIIEEATKLDLDLSDLTGKAGKKLICVEKRQYYPPSSSIKILNDLAEKINIPPSTIVSRLIINPLLK